MSEQEEHLQNASNSIPALQNDGSDDVIGYLLLLFKHMWFILIFTLLCAITTGVIVFRLPNVFSSTVSVVPPKKSSSAMDGVLSSVASTLKDIGIAKVGGNKGGGGGYEFSVVLNSRSLRDSIINKFELYKVYDIPQGVSKDSAMYYTRLEFDENYSVDLAPEGNYLITCSDHSHVRAAEMCNYAVEIANTIAQYLDREENKVILRQFEEKISATENKMNAMADSLSKYSKSSMVYSPLDQAKAAATTVAESKAMMLQQEIGLQLLQEQYGKEDARTQLQDKLVNDLRTKVNELESKPGFMGNFSLKDAPSAAYNYMRFYVELETMIKLKAMLVPSFEQTKLDQTKYAPALFVVDSAIPAIKKDRPKRSVMILVSLISGLFASCLFVLGRYQTSKLIQRINAYSAK
ncbi:MAG: hypothetical protein JNJ85_01945 [Candidatus Kapabacteria bacterium]|nr:hypothetical protein [Candidatus Kapabacteria bacterium]